MSVIGAMFFTLGGGGCSFLFSEGAPADHERRTHFVCGTSYAPPVLDTIAAGLFTLAAASKPDETLSQDEQDAARVIQIGAALITAGAAVYGYTAVSDCREATAMREADVARGRFLPPPYGVYPNGAPPLYWPPPPVSSGVPAPWPPVQAPPPEPAPGPEVSPITPAPPAPGAPPQPPALPQPPISP